MECKILERPSERRCFRWRFIFAKWAHGSFVRGLFDQVGAHCRHAPAVRSGASSLREGQTLGPWGLGPGRSGMLCMSALIACESEGPFVDCGGTYVGKAGYFRYCASFRQFCAS